VAVPGPELERADLGEKAGSGGLDDFKIVEHEPSEDGERIGRRYARRGHARRRTGRRSARMEERAQVGLAPGVAPQNEADLTKTGGGENPATGEEFSPRRTQRDPTDAEERTASETGRILDTETGHHESRFGPKCEVKTPTRHHGATATAVEGTKGDAP
jgi:hypothetical protein